MGPRDKGWPCGAAISDLCINQAELEKALQPDKALPAKGQCLVTAWRLGATRIVACGAPWEASPPSGGHD